MALRSLLGFLNREMFLFVVIIDQVRASLGDAHGHGQGLRARGSQSGVRVVLGRVLDVWLLQTDKSWVGLVF